MSGIARPDKHSAGNLNSTVVFRRQATFLPESKTINPGRFWFSVPSPVQHPGTERRVSESGIPSLHQQLRRRVIELIRTHGLDKTNLIELLLQMGQPIGYPVTTLVRPDETGTVTLAALERR